MFAVCIVCFVNKFDFSSKKNLWLPVIFLEDLGLFQLCIFYVAEQNKKGVHANLNLSNFFALLLWLLYFSIYYLFFLFFFGFAIGNMQHLRNICVVQSFFLFIFVGGGGSISIFAFLFFFFFFLMCLIVKILKFNDEQMVFQDKLSKTKWFRSVQAS